MKAVQQLNDLEIAGLKIKVAVAPWVPLVPDLAVPQAIVNELDEEGMQVLLIWDCTCTGELANPNP